MGLSLIKLKYSFFLALLGGIFEILPMIGPTIVGIVGVSLAFMQGGVGLGIMALLVFFLVQQIENYFLVPYVMREKVKLAVLLGESKNDIRNDLEGHVKFKAADTLLEAVHIAYDDAEKGDIVVVLNKDKIGLIDKSEYNLTLSNYFQEP